MTYAYVKCKNILVDDYSKPYRDEVVHYLDLIATTDVGRTLYAFLGKPAKTVRITWTLGTSWLLTGATSISKSDVDRVAKAGERIARERRISIQAAVDAAFEEDAIIRAKTRGQYAKGHPVMQEIFISVFETLGLHSTFQFPTLETGTGEGIDVELDYHPAAFARSRRTPAAPASAWGREKCCTTNSFMRCG